MATKNFKGFQLVALATFNGAGFTKDKDTLYFVRTNEAKSDGFLYFNGKKYGTAEDVKEALTKKYGDLKIGEKNATIAEYVAEQLKDIKGVTKTDFDAVKAESAANKAAIDRLNGAEDAEGSVAKAVKDAKTLLVGDAAEGYNTLGKLEDKIQEEASTARAAEKANKEAAAAAKTAADNAQATADAKVASVTAKDGETAIEVDNTTATTPKISLKLDNDGNVKFVQTAKGLKGSVKIPEATVTGVKADDKVLALDGTELTSTISLSIDATAGDDGKKYIRLKGIGGADLGKIDTADFVKDGMLDSAELVTNPSGQTEGTYIKLTWNTDGGKDPMYINVTSLIDIYTAGNGLNLNGHEFSVNFDVAATKASVDTVADRVSTLEGKVGSPKVGETLATGLFKDVADNKAAIEAETTRAQGAEQANANAITILNGDSGVTGSVDQKIKTALEAGAVTLEVKDNDAYLGVTSATTAGKGTVYTLASKEAAINDAIKNAADAVKVSVINGTYVKGSVDEAGRVITLSEKVQAVAAADANVAEKKGLAEASDVKNYVDQKVSDKNVAASGETGDTALVSASASGNTVTVATTQKLKDAVAKAESSVQSVNGVQGTAVTLKATDIEVGAGVSGQTETATVNAVLADIYSKIGAVKVSSEKKTITVDEKTGRIIDVNRQTVTAAQQAGHVALECGNDGALYGVMYYSGDDVDETIA